MDARTIVNRVLIITNDASDAAMLKAVLANAHDGPFAIEWVTRLVDGIERLRAGGVDVVMADLWLPDSQGIATFDQLYAAVPQTPIMTLSAADDEPFSIEAVQRGSQGYLSKGHFGSYLVPQSLRNIIQRKAVEQTLSSEKARAEITLNSISDAVIGTDLLGNIDYLNLAAENMTGWSKEEARGNQIGEVMQIIDSKTLEPMRNPIEIVLRKDAPTSIPPGTILIRRDGSTVAIEDSAAPIHDASGEITGAVVVFHDITGAQATAAKMTHLAQHDFLTGLPNRILLNDRIAHAIAAAQRDNTQLAVLFLDLDNFKLINDTLGHMVGDKLLRSVAQRLRECVRGSDTVSRQGGDEFILLLPEEKDGGDAALTAERILTALSVSHTIDEHELHVTPSIGISVYPADAKNFETLIKNADTAMYHAKESGRNNYQFFEADMNARAVERQVIEAHLRHALERDEFILYYQPKVNLASGTITGAEALVRWMHPERGIMLPARFVPVAEACGLIVRIGRWVLREACAQVKRWESSGLWIASMAVNVSELEFRSPDFVEGVRVILNETGLEAGRLQLEITESVLMRDAEASTAVLEQLKDMGVRLAVDDFGTGFSSLSYLNQFPIDVLKIDQSFVRSIGSSEGGGSIVSAVIAVGASLKQHVVAEGVEKSTQLAFLKNELCEEGQGYFFSEPLSAKQFALLLATGVTTSGPDFVEPPELT